MKTLSYGAWWLLFACTASLLASEPFEQVIILLNDDERPLRGVPIEASTVVGWLPGRDFGKDIRDEQTVITDSLGRATIRLQSGNGSVSLVIRGSETIYGQRWEWQTKDIGKHPIIVYAKAKQEPVAMYIRDIGEGWPYWARNLPSRKDECKFDLLEGDWLPPFGSGKRCDIAFRLIETIPFKAATERFDVSLQLEFSGDGNGIAVAKSREPGPSGMPLARHAPELGYERELFLRRWNDANGAIHSSTNGSEDSIQGYFIRIRSVVDVNQQVVHARYGKILGSVSFVAKIDGQTRLAFRYFVSNREDDRNMEHRTDVNLFKDADPAGRRLSK